MPEVTVGLFYVHLIPLRLQANISATCAFTFTALQLETTSLEPYLFLATSAIRASSQPLVISPHLTVAATVE